MQYFHKWLGWIVLGIFLISVFPAWYHLSYTKIWELKQMIGSEREAQMLVLHPAQQMGQLIALRSHLEQNFSHQKAYIYIPQPTTLPLSQNPMLVRGVLQNTHQYELVIQPASQLVQNGDQPCVFLGDASLSSLPFPQPCTFWSGQ